MMKIRAPNRSEEYALVEDYSYSATEDKGTITHFVSNDRREVRDALKSYKDKLLKEFVINLGWRLMRDSGDVVLIAKQAFGYGYIQSFIRLSIQPRP